MMIGYLWKPKKSAVSYMETATYELPYDGAKDAVSRRY